MGPATGTPMGGTVVNSANPYQSANPYASGNPYTSNGAQPQGSSKKGLWIGIAVAAVILLGAGAFFLFGASDKTEATEATIDPAEQQKQMEQAEYERALALFNQNNADSIQVAFNRMKVLADNGNKDAIFEVAKTYAWIPNDTESDRRKHLMGWSITNEGALMGAPASDDINREAITWLQKAVDMQVPNYHQCLYWLSFYYYYGLGTKEDVQKTIALLRQANDEAVRSQDYVFKEKIEKTLEQLN